MSGIDLPALAAVAPPTKAKSPRISKAVRAACDALVAGKVKTITDAAALGGVRREHISRELSKPHVIEYLRGRASRVVAIAAAPAAARLVELLNAGSEHVSLDASKLTLAIAGIKPAAEPNINFNLEVKAGWVLDLRDDPIDVTPNKPTNNAAR